MLLLVLLNVALALAGLTTFRSYKPNCSALVEDTPWIISDFVHFQASRSRSDCQSYVRFDFADVNKGLRANTTCNRYLPFHSNSSVIDESWYKCENEEMLFMFLGENLQVSRWYEDDCLGDPPYNNAIAYGRMKTNLTRIMVKNGILATQTWMHMPISSLS